MSFIRRNRLIASDRIKSWDILGIHTQRQTGSIDQFPSEEIYLLHEIGHKIIRFDDKCDSLAFVAGFNALVFLSKQLCIHPQKHHLIKTCMLLIRCGLWSEVKEIRCAALRCLRYFVHNKADVDMLIQLHLDYFIGRSLDLSWDDSSRISFRHMHESERVQALRCIWLICEVAPELVATSAPSLLRPLLDELNLAPRSSSATAAGPNNGTSMQQALHMMPNDKQLAAQMTSFNNTNSDKAMAASVLLLCQMTMLCPSKMSIFGVDRALINALLNHFTETCSPDHSKRLTEGIMLALLHMLDTPAGRQCLSEGQMEKILTPITRLSYEQIHSSNNSNEYSVDQLKIAKQAFLLTMHSWPGFIYFCQPNSQSMFSLTDILSVGHTETRRELLDLLFDLFFLPKPSCLNKCKNSSSAACSSFEKLLHEMKHFESVKDARQLSNWSLENGFTAAEALTLLPYRSAYKIDLVEHQLALTLVLMIECHLLEALCDAVTDEDDTIAMAATLLLGQLIHMTTILLPPTHPMAQRVDTLQLLGKSKEEVAVHRMERVHKALQDIQDSVSCQRLYSPFLFYLCAQATDSAALFTAYPTQDDSLKRLAKGQESLLDQMVHEAQVLHWHSIVVQMPSSKMNRNSVNSANASNVNPATTAAVTTRVTLSAANPNAWDWDLIVCFMKRLNEPRGFQQFSVKWDENANVVKLLRTLMDFFTPPMPRCQGNQCQLALPQHVVLVQGTENGEFITQNGRHVNKVRSSKQYFITSNSTLQSATAFTTVFMSSTFCQQSLQWPAAKRAAHSLVELLQHLANFPPNTEAARRCREFVDRYEKCLLCLLRHLHLHPPLMAQNGGEEDMTTADTPNNISSSSSDDNLPAFSSQSLQRTSCLQYIFLAVGRLTATERGDDLLEECGVIQSWRDVIVHSDECSLIKLILSSLDYTRRSHSRTLLNAASTSLCESTRLYTAQLIRSLYRAKLPFFSSWCVDILLRLLQDTSHRVVLEAMDALQEVCEDEVNVNHLQSHCGNVAHLGYPGMLLMARILSNEVIYNKFKQIEALQFVLEEWRNKYSVEYVHQVELGLFTCYSSYEPPSVLVMETGGVAGDVVDESQHRCAGAIDPWMSSKLSGRRPSFMLSNHLFAGLSQHKEGLQLLLSSGQLSYTMDILSRAQEADNSQMDVLAVKSAMWSVAHVCSTAHGMEWADHNHVVDLICHLAYYSPCLSVRGTAVFCLSLVASTVRGADYLEHHFHWHPVRSNRFQGGPSSVLFSYPLSSHTATSHGHLSSSNDSAGDTVHSVDMDTLQQLSKQLTDMDSEDDHDHPGLESTPYTPGRKRCESVIPLSQQLVVSRESSLSFHSHQNGGSSSSNRQPPITTQQWHSLGRSVARQWTTTAMVMKNNSSSNANNSGVGVGNSTSASSSPHIILSPLSPQDVRGFAELSRLYHISHERQLTEGRLFDSNDLVQWNQRKISVGISPLLATNKMSQYRGLAVPLSMSMLGNDIYLQRPLEQREKAPRASFSHHFSQESKDSAAVVPQSMMIPCTCYHSQHSLLLKHADLIPISPASSAPGVGDPTLCPPHQHHVDCQVPVYHNYVMPPPQTPPPAKVFIYHTAHTCLCLSCPGDDAAHADGVTANRERVVNAVQNLLRSRDRQNEVELLAIRDTQRDCLADGCLISEIACRLQNYEAAAKQSRLFIHEIFFGIRPAELYEDAKSMLQLLRNKK